MVKVADLKFTWRYGFCVYCGVQVQTKQRGPIACHACRELLQRDPHYCTPRDQWAAAR